MVSFHLKKTAAAFSISLPHLFQGITSLIHSAAHANWFGLWPILFESRPPQRAGFASLSNSAQNASLPCQSELLSGTSLPVISLASCWFGCFSGGVLFFFLQEDGVLPPGGGQSSWPYDGELSVWLRWFYSAPLSRTAGCDSGRCGTAKADSIEKPKALWEALIKGAGCFWFTLLSLYTFNSQISLLKLGLFVFSGNV